MNYYLDCEFHEAFTTPMFRKKRHYIDLISIAVVSEDGREFHCISKEFDLVKAWKDVWIRENVLRPLHGSMVEREGNYAKTYHSRLFVPFCIDSMRRLLSWQGRPLAEIAWHLDRYIRPWVLMPNMYSFMKDDPISFYTYYGAYDWVLVASLFGRMVDLPAGWPMFAHDLKSMLDQAVGRTEFVQKNPHCEGMSLKDKLHYVKCSPNYPIDKGTHLAEDDARFNKELHQYINGILLGELKV